MIGRILKKTQDPGTGTAYTRNSKRVINKNGSFNVLKIGLPPSYRNTYQALIQMSWPRFFIIVFAFLFCVNAVFAFLYLLAGIDGISSLEKVNFWQDFQNAFFFSFQSFTTVGYGYMAPVSMAVQWIALFETVAGWLCFALVTGILYGRFSRPSARLKYSENAIVSPYKDGLKSLQFRIANMRNSTLIDMEATVLFVIVENVDGKEQRQFLPLELERDRILFFPLNWTIVHPINENSPLYGMSYKDLEEKNAELLILVKGFDDTFSQTVHSRYSYKFDEMVWGAKFVAAYETHQSGDFVIDFEKIDHYQETTL